MVEGLENRENNIEKVTREEVEALLSDLEQYDHDHSQGAWLGRGLAGLIMSQFEGLEEDESGENLESEPSGLQNLQEKISQNLKLQDVLDKNQRTLEKIGIDLESPNPHGDYDEHETYAVGDMKIDFTNQEKFVDYLKSLDEKNLAVTDLKLVKMVMQKVLNRVRSEYSFESTDDRLLELFSGIKNMVEECGRLGLEEEAAELDRCIHYNKQRSLPEYIFARNRSFLEPIGEGFNWSTYQGDSSHDSYIKYWDKAFEALDRAKENPKSSQLYQDILSYAKACIEFAKKDLELSEQGEKIESNDVKTTAKAIRKIHDKLSSY